MLKKHLVITLVALAVAFVSMSARSDSRSNPDTLRVALLPDENASTIIKNNQALKVYLEERLGKKIKLVVTTDYSSMVEAMRFGRLELAYFGPLSYLLTKSKADIEPFAAQKKNGVVTYSAVVITHVDSGINTIQDIRGKDMAYGDPASTSSHLMPRTQLLKKGLEINVDYEPHYLGAHDSVAISVQNRNADAGGLSQPIFESLVSRNIISLDKVKVLEVSPPYTNYPWTMQSYLIPELKQAIRTAFLDLEDPNIMQHFKAEGFGAVTDADYESLRTTAKLLGLLK